MLARRAAKGVPRREKGECSPAPLPKVYHVAKEVGAALARSRRALPRADDERTPSLCAQSIPVADASGATMDKAAMAAAFGGVPNGIKLESFIFDVFPAAQRMAALEVERAAEFSPVKNAPGSAEDSPDTARALLSALHRGWLAAAGARVEGDGLVEVSAAASYAGEGLESLAGATLRAPLLVRRRGEDGGELPARGGAESAWVE